MAVQLYFILTLAFSIISINTQGLRSDDRRQLAFSFFKRQNFDFILLQETHWTPDLMDTVKREWLGSVYASHGTNTSCGTAILIHPNISPHVQSVSCDHAGRIVSINSRPRKPQYFSD